MCGPIQFPGSSKGRASECWPSRNLWNITVASFITKILSFQTSFGDSYFSTVESLKMIQIVDEFLPFCQHHQYLMARHVRWIFAPAFSYWKKNTSHFTQLVDKSWPNCSQLCYFNIFQLPPHFNPAWYLATCGRTLPWPTPPGRPDGHADQHGLVLQSVPAAVHVFEAFETEVVLFQQRNNLTNLRVETPQTSKPWKKRAWILDSLMIVGQRPKG